MMEQNYNYEEEQGFKVINSMELTDVRYPRIDWIVKGLIKPGLSVLAGAPKIGKSWMVLQLCLAVAKGESFWGAPTRQGAVLYITLEDSEMRVQERILRITDEADENLYITLNCPALGDELMQYISLFYKQHTDLRLIVIDTFQKIREQANQMSYAGDYADVSAIKKIADALKIGILLVHHTRKLGDSDFINEISGTNGIAGSADTLMILKKEKRTERNALLSCTGRDIEDREIELNLDRETCVWNVVSDSVKEEPKEIPPTMLRLIAYVGQIGSYNGSNTDFCEQFGEYCGCEISPITLKRMMNRFRYELEDAGVFFVSVKRNGLRRLALYYKKRSDGLSLPAEEAEEEASLWR